MAWSGLPAITENSTNLLCFCNTEDLLIFRLESSPVPFFFHSSCWFIKVKDPFTLSLSDLFQILAVRRTVTSADIFPTYSRHCLPAQQYFLLQLHQRANEYIYAVDCEGLETNVALQSLDVVVQDVDGNRRWLCYIRFVENNTFCAYPGRNPDH